MFFTLPLVMFSEKNHLQELQNGLMYMRNVSHYRQMESESGNTIQGDQLESKLPYSGRHFKKLLRDNNIPMENIVSNWSLMAANTFICCMYAYKESNIVNRGKNEIALGINMEQDYLNKLGDHALVICDPDRFIQSFNSISTEYNYKQHGYVKYYDLHDHETSDTETEKYIVHLASTDPQKTIRRPEFIKHIKYEYQQEYRFVVNTGFSPEDIVNEYQGKIKNDDIKVTIEDCTSHSFICLTEDLFRHTLCFKWEDDKFKVRFRD